MVTSIELKGPDMNVSKVRTLWNNNNNTVNIIIIISTFDFWSTGPCF
jgi:hypothetical protein